MSRVRAVLLPLLLLVASSTPALADPIRVISGVVDTAFGPLNGPWDGEDLQLTGAGLSVSNALEDTVAFVQLATLPTVTPGALVDFSGVLRAADAIGGRLNNSDGIVAAPFTMSFNTASARLTCTSTAALIECAATTPFTFSADLTFTPFGGVASTHRLVGSGTAEGRLFRSSSTERGAVRYNFGTSPVPEPATLTLFITGAILVAAGIRRWRTRRAVLEKTESVQMVGCAGAC